MKPWVAFLVGLGCTLLGVLVGRSFQPHLSLPAGNPKWLVPAELQRPSPDSLLARSVGDLDLRNTTLESAIDHLQMRAGAPVSMNWKAIQDAGGSRADPVDAMLYSANVDTALRLLRVSCRCKLHYWADHHTIYVSTDFPQLPPVTAIYDVSEQLSRLEQHYLRVHPSGPPVATPGLFGISSQASNEAYLEFISQLIEDRIAPETWTDNGGAVGSIAAYEKHLFVRHSPENQQRISRLLDGLGQ